MGVTAVDNEAKDFTENDEKSGISGAMSGLSGI